MIKKFMIFVIAACVLFAGLLHYEAKNKRSSEPALVEIMAGASVKKIASELAQKKIIANPKLFELLARAKGIDRKMRAGMYEFEAGTTLMSALGKIERGEVVQYPLTVVEGFSINDIAAALTREPFVFSEDAAAKFSKLANDKEFAAKLGIAANSLEGYLFPDTYFLTKPFSAETILQRFVERFVEVWNSLGHDNSKADSFSKKDIVTLASVIEKETGAPEERPLIASVFYNRLRIGMPLQSDPTIIYGLKNFDGNIRKKDITNPHAYNTYAHRGIPPGPICNPGRASLEAAIHPAATKYLYFVSRNDGTHVFSETGAEHDAAVRKYQTRKAKP